MITLTAKYQNKILVQKENITHIVPVPNGGSIIHFVGGTTIQVTETIDIIKDML